MLGPFLKGVVALGLGESQGGEGRRPIGQDNLQLEKGPGGVPRTMDFGRTPAT